MAAMPLVVLQPSQDLLHVHQWQKQPGDAAGTLATWSCMQGQ